MKKNIVDGYEIGKLQLVVQGIEQKKTGKIVQGVFCTLYAKKKGGEEEKINFIFALSSIPSFKKHIVSMTNQAIELKIKSDAKKKIVAKNAKK